MKKSEDLNTISNGKLMRMLGAIAAPIAAQSLIGSSLNLIDNLMVGSLGELELNAVGVSVQIFFIYWMLVYGFCSGAATFISQFYGADDFTNIKKTAGFTITVTLGVGLLFFAAAEIFPEYILRVFTRFPEVIELGKEYVRFGAPTFLLIAVTQPLTVALRATQQTTVPLVASVLALCTNTLLNYALIFGKFGAPAMGVAGAAIATSIARVIELCLILVFVFGFRNRIAGSFREYFGYSRDLAGRIFSNSLPTTINETMWGLGTSMYVAAFARIGITAGAAIQACNTINNIFSMAAFSIGDAVLILVGQRLGENKINEGFEIARKLIKVGLAIGVIMGGCTILLGRPILSLFDFTPTGESYAMKILIVYGATFWLQLYNGIQVTGTLRCGGDTRFAMFIEVGTVWLIGVPLAFISALYLHLPIYFAVLAVKIEEVVKAIFLTRRYLTRKWLRNVIEDIEKQ